MPTTNCKNCRKDFAYDFEFGINIKYYESTATATYFRGGGDAPCCPDCETRCEPETTVQTIFDLKIERRFILRKDIVEPIKKLRE